MLLREIGCKIKRFEVDMLDLVRPDHDVEQAEKESGVREAVGGDLANVRQGYAQCQSIEQSHGLGGHILLALADL